MARNRSIPTSDPTVNNGRPPEPGDAHEPPAVPEADLAFDRAELEAQAPATPETPTGPDPYDLDSLRVTTDMAAAVGVKPLLTEVPVRKPGRTQWVRVHPNPAYSLTTLLLELKEQRDEVYLIAPALRPLLATEPAVALFSLHVAVTRQGVVFLWPVRLPGADSRVMAWTRSALEAVELARTRWVRVAANMSLGAYEMRTTEAEIPGPGWPEQSFSQLLRIAFKDRLIDSAEHPVLRQLQGRA
jgi:hypothetical protein